jgi:hypothetical protein
MEIIRQPPPNWEEVADRYTTRFLTPRDGATHFKLITHRALYTPATATPLILEKTNYADCATKHQRTQHI